MPEHDLSDIQGYVLRGYNRMHAARHFLLKIADVDAFRGALRDLVIGTDATGRIQDAADWGEPGPTNCLNIAFTHDGLRAAGVPEDELARFPKEFGEGAEARAETVGDVGDSAPKLWVDGIRGVHCIL